MATPMSTTSQDEAANKKLEQITFRFCSECSNMLYPKEDEETHRLQFTCRTCQFTEEAQSTCVFRNVMNNAAGETAGVTQDVGSDPTVGDSQSILAPVLPRSNKECPACKGGEAVFFQSQQRSAETGMKLFYVCCDCGHIFQ
ncbi:DNA-directed RNA polymerase II subunit RPB9 [Colletotrichum spaethianum]|uniref:DNA-directed RNA polymerase subunit n=1 Tax=Colletotrichum spaethianum TaxID=700344 RepID=A0AA37P8D9_9PEZI|nr:DNA-directed RNA polymerase II subunit RPB9 [Colletotrichum spaethianum]GKT47547.1 DNA-directed RNA polymerase II subunit RPB9 [Colletotrichum spaethianum]